MRISGASSWRSRGKTVKASEAMRARITFDDQKKKRTAMVEEGRRRDVAVAGIKADEYKGHATSTYAKRHLVLEEEGLALIELARPERSGDFLKEGRSLPSGWLDWSEPGLGAARLLGPDLADIPACAGHLS